jgi:hypothetical protein
MTRRHRPPAWALLCCAGLLLWFVGSAPATAETPAAVPVVLEGSGDNDVVGALTPWQNTLFEADQPTDVQYFQRGSLDGRAQLLNGQADFAVSGVPFSAAELQARPADAGAIVEVPIAVSSMSIVATTPVAGAWNTVQFRCDPDDPDVPDPDACIVRGKYEGPVRLPADSLAALAVGLTPDFEQNRLSLWESPAVVEALGTSELEIQSRSLRHTFLNRTEGSAANKYLMEYAAALGTTAWDLRKKENPQFAWEPIGEQMSPRTLSRFGADTQIGLIAIANVDAATNSVNPTWSGNMGGVPTLQVEKLSTDYPAAGWRVVEVQNKLGEYVAPTPESIAASIAASTEPLAAVRNDVAGGYPFVWVTNLYTVAGSLTPDEANSLAALIRYVVTDGQQQVVDRGGVPLPAALVDSALAAANSIVTGNCAVQGFEVSTGGPAATEPKTPEVQALTGLSHCVRVESAPPTTTTVATTATTSASTTAFVPPTTAYVPPPTPRPNSGSSSASGGRQPASADPLPSTVTTVVESPTSTTAAETPSTTTPPRGGVSRFQASPLARLPLDLPDDGRTGFKRLGTLMLGAGMYLWGRRVVAARRRTA